MNNYNKQYLDLVEEILIQGKEAPCRTGNNVLVRLNKHLTWDLNEGFPILTFRQIPFKGVKGELSCFLEGITDIIGDKMLGMSYDINVFFMTAQVLPAVLFSTITTNII